MPDHRNSDAPSIRARTRFDTGTTRSAAWEALWGRLLDAIRDELESDVAARDPKNRGDE